MNLAFIQSLTRKKPFFSLKAFFLLLFCLFLCFLLFLLVPTPLDPNDINTNVPPIAEKDGVEPTVREPIEIWKPVTPDIALMKKRGCVVDGLLNRYNRSELDIPLVRDSHCYYFHRALETWLEPPNFDEVAEIIEELERPDAVYGMFIAEAIDTKSDYIYRAQAREFDFGEMCRSKSKNFWGEHTCKPSLKKSEYQAYLSQITRDAMDVGIRVFLFGQIQHQEESTRFPKVDNVIDDMKEYAQSKGITILVGAQTGDITRKSYLKLFDFIDGGAGLRSDGQIEPGPCFSVYQQIDTEWCWPLMWHDDYRKGDHEVLVYFDWNGQTDDEMHIFAQMDTRRRHDTLDLYYREMAKRDVGFLFPLITPLPRDGEGNCHGPRSRYYSPHMDHGCKDVDAINQILSGS